MTMHGFGWGDTGSERPSREEIAEIAAKISEVPGVIWAHRVSHSKEKWPDNIAKCMGNEPTCDIIFEFGHPPKFRKTLASLLGEICRIKSRSGKGIHNIRVHIIQESYKG